MSSKIRLVILNSFWDRGQKVAYHLKHNHDIIDRMDNLVVPIKQPRFSNGEGKVILYETVRHKEVFIMSDIGNYGCSYQFRDQTHFMTPDEHFADIKRAISAIKGHASSITVVMPLFI